MPAFYTLRPSASTALYTPKIIKVVEPARVVRAVSITHHNCKLDHDQLAQLGADWLDGSVFMLPSLTLISDALGVSYQALVEARGKQGNRPDPSIWLKLLMRCWMSCSPEQHAILVADKEREVWAALEHAVDHQD